MKMPRSRYVRDAIKGLAFTEEHRKFLHDLMTIENLVLRGPRSMSEGLFEAQLQRAYREAFDCILRELNPERYERELEWRKETREFMRRERRTAIEAKRLKLERDRELWSELGGKLD